MAPAAASRLHRSRQRYNRVCDRSRSLLEQGDFEEALRAATAIGDDTLQKQAPGRVVPESFTHGSAEQRLRWFRRGLERGEVAACDTFPAKAL